MRSFCVKEVGTEPDKPGKPLSHDANLPEVTGGKVGGSIHAV